MGQTRRHVFGDVELQKVLRDAPVLADAVTRLAGALPAGERAGVWGRFHLEYKRRSGHTLCKHDERRSRCPCPDRLRVDSAD